MSEIRPDAIDLEEKPMPPRVTLPLEASARLMPVVAASKRAPRRDSYIMQRDFDMENHD